MITDEQAAEWQVIYSDTKRFEGQRILHLLADRAERVRIERELRIATRLCAQAAEEEQEALCSGVSMLPGEYDALMKKVNAALAVARVLDC